MIRVSFAALTFGFYLVTACSVALAQDPHQLQIDDNGRVLPEHQQHHAKKGNKISWVRQTGAAKSWYVKFTGESPCMEGKTIAGVRGACTVKAICNKSGDPGCKSYHYQSAIARKSPMNDPEIIIDP
jgi:hypothetical protein